MTGTAICTTPAKYPGKYIVEQNNTMNGYKEFYWIIMLGPLANETNSLYPWAVVSVPFGLDVFILARNVTEFEEMYEEEVLGLVRDRGYTYPLNMPIKTFQSETECNYPPSV